MNHNPVGLQVLTTVTMKNIIFRMLTPCSPAEVRWRFGRTLCFPLHGWTVRQTRESKLVQQCLIGFSVRSLFDPENGGSMFLAVIDKHVSDSRGYIPESPHCS
jgi:hypothetical protein